MSTEKQTLFYSLTKEQSQAPTFVKLTRERGRGSRPTLIHRKDWAQWRGRGREKPMLQIRQSGQGWPPWRDICAEVWRKWGSTFFRRASRKMEWQMQKLGDGNVPHSLQTNTRAQGGWSADVRGAVEENKGPVGVGPCRPLRSRFCKPPLHWTDKQTKSQEVQRTCLKSTKKWGFRKCPVLGFLLRVQASPHGD